MAFAARYWSRRDLKFSAQVSSSDDSLSMVGDFSKVLSLAVVGDGEDRYLALGLAVAVWGRNGGMALALLARYLRRRAFALRRWAFMFSAQASSSDDSSLTYNGLFSGIVGILFVLSSSGLLRLTGVDCVADSFRVLCLAVLGGGRGMGVSKVGIFCYLGWFVGGRLWCGGVTLYLPPSHLKEKEG